MRHKQTPEQKAASKAFSDTLRGQSRPNAVSIPFTREHAPHRHPKTGQFISRADMNDYFRQAMLGKMRPGLSPDNSTDADIEAQEGGGGGSD